MVQNYLETLNWEVPSRLLVRPGTFWLSYVFVDALAERHFDSYEDVRKWIDEWFGSRKIRDFLAWYALIARKMGNMYS